jgi:hypothetical protein
VTKELQQELLQLPEPFLYATYAHDPMPSAEQDLSLKLKSTLRRLTDSDPAYWDHSSIKTNSNAQAYFQYPAMMVPGMQGDIIDAIKKVFPDTKRTFDPFAGSGTILVESLKRAMSSIASDINPMAILMCRVKTQPFRVAEAENALDEVLRSAREDSATTIELAYVNAEKWFCAEALQELSKLRRAIALVDDLQLRRLLWVAFAEAVRISSNSRTSTYKLHIRSSDDIEHRAAGVKERIISSMTQVVRMYRTNYELLKAAGHLVGNHFRKEALVLNHDIRKPFPGRRADALISSPSYGDNHTTVTYGQHSFLPLSWIPLEDIDPSLEPTLLANTHAIDTASLGGRRENITTKKQKICDRSLTLSTAVNRCDISKDAEKRLVSFFYDLDQGLGNALSVLRTKRPIVLTLGNRCVDGQRIQTDQIVRELLAYRGCEFIDTHNRAIPTKRMAHRNKSAGTMLTETLLVMRGPDK